MTFFYCYGFLFFVVLLFVSQTTATGAGIASPAGAAARKVDKTVFKETKETQETQEVSGGSGAVTTRVAFGFGFCFCFFSCFFLYFVFFGFVFSTKGTRPTAEAATIAPSAAKGAAERQGETQAKRTVVQQTKETKEVCGHGGQ